MSNKKKLQSFSLYINDLVLSLFFGLLLNELLIYCESIKMMSKRNKKKQKL